MSKELLKDYQLDIQLDNSTNLDNEKLQFILNLLSNTSREKIETNIYNMYMQFIRSIAAFYKDMHLENPVHIRIVNGNMLNKGYLSNDMSFICGDSRVKDLPSSMGADIINGHGVCRHIAPQLCTCFKNMGLDSNLLLAFTLSIKKQYLEKECIEPRVYERKYSSQIYLTKEKMLQKVEKLLNLPNHVIIITSYQNKTYILDPTLNCALRINQNGELILLNNNAGKMRLIQPDDYYVDASQIMQLLSQEIVGYEEYRELCAEGNQIYQSNISAIEDFYQQNAKLYAEISGEMSKIHRFRFRI